MQALASLESAVNFAFRSASSSLTRLFISTLSAVPFESLAVKQDRLSSPQRAPHWWPEHTLHTCYFEPCDISFSPSPVTGPLPDAWSEAEARVCRSNAHSQTEINCHMSPAVSFRCSPISGTTRRVPYLGANNQADLWFDQS